MLPTVLLAAAFIRVSVPLQPRSSVHLAHARTPVTNLLATTPRRKVSELKRLLEAAGVSTAGIVEKEELERLCDALESSEPPSDETRATLSFPLVYMMDGAYADLNGQRLLVDTGSAVSIVSAAAASQLKLERGREALELRDGTRLPGFAVAAAQQVLPPGVSGILGINCMRQFARVELDWSTSRLRLHVKVGDGKSSGGGGDGTAGSAVSMPLTMRRVSAGELPFVAATFGSRADGARRAQVEALVDTGSPVTMVTPELAAAAGMAGSSGASDDVLTTGVDGRPTRMRASRCDVVALGAPGERRVAHLDATVFAGVCPMMQAVGWQGTPAALLGLDVLRGGVRGGAPKHPAAGGPAAGRLVLDMERGEMIVCE
jgi:predicted aspartyl protease